VPIERAQIDRPDLTARRARERKPREASRDGGPDRRVEPQGSTAGLPRVPDRNNLLRFDDRLALGLGASGLGRCLSGGALAVLSSSVRTHYTGANWSHTNV